MEIDKSKGDWYENSTQIQDYSYYLYIKNFIPLEHVGNNVGSIVTQEDFISINKYTDFMDDHFKNAKQIIRKEKIEKIFLNIQIKTLSL